MANLVINKPNVTINSYDDLDRVHGIPNSPYYLRIGDTQFILPPTAISVEHEGLSTMTPLLRSNTSMKSSTGRQVTMLTVEIYFHNLTSINGKRVENPLYSKDVDASTREKKYYYIDGLRSLIAQFSKTPFLPIENEYINEVLNIDAVSLANFELQTVPDFPSTLRAKIQMYRFNYEGYLPWIGHELPDKESGLFFKQAFNWPLFRWHYQKGMDDSTLIRGRLRDDIQFSILDEDELMARDEARKTLMEERDNLNKSVGELLRGSGIADASLVEDQAAYLTSKAQYYDVIQRAEEIGRSHERAISNFRTKDGITFNMVEVVNRHVVMSFPVFSSDIIAAAKARDRWIDALPTGRVRLYPEGHPSRTNADAELEDVIESTVSEEKLRFLSETRELVRKNRDTLRELEEYAQKVETDISTTPIDTSGMTIEQVSISLRNVLAQRSLQLQNDPVHQYMGSQDATVTLDIKVTSRATVEALRGMVEKANELQLTYRDDIIAGFIAVDNDLLRLFGVKHVFVERMTIDTADSPGLWNVSMTLVRFDPTQREVEDLDGHSGIEDNVDYSDLRHVARPITGIRNYLYLRKKIREINPYPDLGLPTWDDVRRVVDAYRGEGVDLGKIGETEGKYAEPDFYVMTMKTLADLVEEAIRTGSTTELHDFYGRKVTITTPSGGEGHQQIILDEETKTSLENFITEAEEFEPEDNEEENHFKDADKRIKEETMPQFERLEDGKWSCMVPIIQSNDDKKFQYGSKEVPSARDRFIGMLHDMVNYTKQGRLVRAFPTFSVMIIDEGEDMSYYQMWDNLYGVHGITSIDIIKSRKNAADTCALEISNLYGNISLAPENDKEHTYSFVNWITSANKLTWEMIAERKDLAARLTVKTGCRLHVRIGYGSNVDDLPVAFNGTVTEIDSREIVTLVAQSDATELTNIIPRTKESTTNRGTNYKNEPRDIILRMLKDEGSWFTNIRRRAAQSIPRFAGFYENSLGIEHFGRVYYRRETVTGDKTWETVDGSEVEINVYPAGGEPTKEESSWFASFFKGLVGLDNTPDEPNMQLYLHDRTPWDIFQVLALAVEDYIVSAQPFELRSTLFYGKPQWPFIYGYEYLGDLKSVKRPSDIMAENISTATKTFQQLHLITSEFDIVSNEIKATSEDMYTQVVTTYKTGKGGSKTHDSMTVYADTDIRPQFQKLIRLDSNLHHRGLFKTFTRRIADMVAANALRDSLKEMYQGQLILAGNPSLKPYDYIELMDTYSDLFGPILVEQVVHHFNLETGFISTVVPDAMVSTGNDIVGIHSWANTVASLVGAGIVARVGMHRIITGSVTRAFDFMKVGGAGLRMIGHTETVSSILGAMKGVADLQAGELAAARALGRSLLQSNKLPVEVLEIASKLSKNEISLIRASADIAGIAGELEGAGVATEILREVRSASRTTKLVAGTLEKSAKVVQQGGSWAEAVKAGAMHLRGLGVVNGLIKFAKGVAPVIMVHGLFDYLLRWAKNRQRCIIFPLKKHGEIYVAGIDGHQGMVWGDPQSSWDSFVESAMQIVGIALLNFRPFDEIQYQPGYNRKEVEDFKGSYGPDLMRIPNIPTVYSPQMPPAYRHITAQKRNQEWFNGLHYVMNQDPTPLGFQLLSYEEETGSDFFRFPPGHDQFLPAMILKLSDLEGKLKNHGFEYVNIVCGYSIDYQEEVGPARVSRSTAELIEYLPHKSGMAIDIEYKTVAERESIISAIKQARATAHEDCIGVNEMYKYVHWDIAEHIPSQVNISSPMWIR